MIKEELYCAFKWLTIEGFNDNEWEKFKTEMSKFERMFVIDGVDEESRSLCFKFNRYKPSTEKAIKICKQSNLKVCKQALNVISQNLGGKTYFNIRRGVIKKL